MEGGTWQAIYSSWIRKSLIWQRYLSFCPSDSPCIYYFSTVPITPYCLTPSPHFTPEALPNTHLFSMARTCASPPGTRSEWSREEPWLTEMGSQACCDQGHRLGPQISRHRTYRGNCPWAEGPLEGMEPTWHCILGARLLPPSPLRHTPLSLSLPLYPRLEHLQYLCSPAAWPGQRRSPTVHCMQNSG